MTTAVRRRCFSFREYLELEEASNTKHDYAEGEIYAMAGGSPAHAALSMAVGGALLVAGRGGSCRVYSSDLRIRAPETGLACYPDVTLVRGEPVVDPESDTTVTNPSLVVEVLSPSTEDYDRGEKLEHYKTISSLHECLLISQDQRRIEVHRRRSDGTWEETIYRGGETLPLQSIQTTLDVDALYDDAGIASS